MHLRLPLEVDEEALNKRVRDLNQQSASDIYISCIEVCMSHAQAFSLTR